MEEGDRETESAKKERMNSGGTKGTFKGCRENDEWGGGGEGGR
jgi:hypothetical protein